jgi:hypothetical protein
MKLNGTWIKRMAAENTQPKFAICINNSGYPDDLRVRTVYQVLPDESAARSNYIRVIDETGKITFIRRNTSSLWKCHAKLQNH